MNVQLASKEPLRNEGKQDKRTYYCFFKPYYFSNSLFLLENRNKSKKELHKPDMLQVIKSQVVEWDSRKNTKLGSSVNQTRFLCETGMAFMFI